MKINDIVECVNDNFPPESLLFINNFPKKKNYYTVREIVEYSSGKIGLLLEEIINPILPNLDVEPTFNISRFKILDIPGYITELIEETNNVPLYL
jgi:hypothetical protein